MSIVELNVGGKVFCTTDTTLLSVHREGEELDYFKSLVTNIQNDARHLVKDKHGIVFIDRCPLYFHHILNYLRDGTLQKNLSAETLSGIQKEAEFYHMPGLVEMTNVKVPIYEYYTVEEYRNNISPDKGRFYSKNIDINALIEEPHMTAPKFQKILIEAGYLIDGAVTTIDNVSNNIIVRFYTIKKLHTC
jgi:hypothetical protein